MDGIFSQDHLEGINLLIDDASFQRISHQAKVNTWGDESAAQKQEQDHRINDQSRQSPVPQEADKSQYDEINQDKL